jgi:hypothetical protein
MSEEFAWRIQSKPHLAKSWWRGQESQCLAKQAILRRLREQQAGRGA